MLDGAALDDPSREPKPVPAACGDDDIFIDPSNHSAGFNAPQIAATRASVVRGKRRSGGRPGRTPEAGRGWAPVSCPWPRRPVGPAWASAGADVRVVVVEGVVGVVLWP